MRPLVPPPRSHHEIAWGEMLNWLHDRGLTSAGSTYDRPNGAGFILTEREVLGLPVSRAESKSREERKTIEERVAANPETLPDQRAWPEVWKELRRPKDTIRQLNPDRLPPDAIAFYRGFHFQPVEQWGVYISLPRLLRYADRLRLELKSLHAMTPSVLMSLVLFEMFHHEFFHHLVECTAASVEILWPAATGKPFPLYLAYRNEVLKRSSEGLDDEPLEEALANAYAYNSLSFMSRVQGGYLAGVSSFYQSALENGWKKEPAGYRDAAKFVSGGRMTGARRLLEQLLSAAGNRPPVPVGMLAQSVFPNGHSAFWAKPDIPTYLVGDQVELDRFHALVPAPNETYSTFYYPADTKRLDAFIKDARRKEREALKAAAEKEKVEKAARKQGSLKF